MGGGERTAIFVRVQPVAVGLVQRGVQRCLGLMRPGRAPLARGVEAAHAGVADRGLQRARLDGGGLGAGRGSRFAAAGGEREQGGSSQNPQAHSHSIRDVGENAKQHRFGEDTGNPTNSA